MKCPHSEIHGVKYPLLFNLAALVDIEIAFGSQSEFINHLNSDDDNVSKLATLKAGSIFLNQGNLYRGGSLPDGYWTVDELFIQLLPHELPKLLEAIIYAVRQGFGSVDIKDDEPKDVLLEELERAEAKKKAIART
jgi:hypothetical protein